MMQSYKKSSCFSCHCEERSEEGDSSLALGAGSAISVVEGMNDGIASLRSQ
jgi:hypothetical protein